MDNSIKKVAETYLEMRRNINDQNVKGQITEGFLGDLGDLITTIKVSSQLKSELKSIEISFKGYTQSSTPETKKYFLQQVDKLSQIILKSGLSDDLKDSMYYSFMGGMFKTINSKTKMSADEIQKFLNLSDSDYKELVKRKLTS